MERCGRIVMNVEDKISANALRFQGIVLTNFILISPLVSNCQRPQTDVDSSRAHIKFDARTTNKQVYQDWKPKRRKRYGEFPAFSSSFVHARRKATSVDPDALKSRSHLDFPYKTIPKPQMVKAMEPNIKVGEGKRYWAFTRLLAASVTTSLSKRKRASEVVLTKVATHSSATEQLKCKAGAVASNFCFGVSTDSSPHHYFRSMHSSIRVHYSQVVVLYYE